MSFRTAELAADGRVREGLEAQLAERARLLEAGERPLGWKLGFGSPPAMAALAIEAPLIGYMTDRSLTDAGGAVEISGWANPVLEAEIAVQLGSAVTPGDPDSARRAIAAVGPAFELADLDPPPERVEDVLAGNVFHRRVVLGPTAGPEASAALAAKIALPDGAVREVDDPHAVNGEPAALVAHVAELLSHFGERLSGGEVIICGTIVPPIQVTPGDAVGYRLDPVGEISLRLE